MSAFFDTGCEFVKGGLDVDANVMRCTFKLGESEEALLAALENGGWQITKRDGKQTALSRNSNPWTNKKHTIKTDTLDIVFYPDNTLEFTWK